MALNFPVNYCQQLTDNAYLTSIRQGNLGEGSPVSKKKIGQLFGPPFGKKIRGGGGSGAPGPLPWIRHCTHIIYSINSRLPFFCTLFTARPASPLPPPPLRASRGSAMHVFLVFFIQC